MKKSAVRLMSTAALAAILTFPAAAFAAEEGGQPKAAPSKPSHVKLETEGAFTSLQIGGNAYVFDSEGPLFQTSGKDQSGSVKDLFVLPYGPQQVPFILVKNEKNGLMVFSDLWPEFTKNDEKKATDSVEAYDSGRVFNAAQSKIVSKTTHHYAEQSGKEVVVYTANDFADLSKGYHESFRVSGKLRGLILYDCCPYAVVDDGGAALSVFHAGEQGAQLAGSIEL